MQIIWMIKDLYPEYYEELPQFNGKKKKKNLTKKWAKDLKTFLQR